MQTFKLELNLDELKELYMAAYAMRKQYELDMKSPSHAQRSTAKNYHAKIDPIVERIEQLFPAI